MMTLHFTKMQGLGNDYLYVFGEVPSNIVPLSQKLSDRHFGAGSDGMIFISPSQIADFRMRIFNADGSEAMMCGNGIRCVGKYVYEKGYTDRTGISVETLSGVKSLFLRVTGGKVKEVSVDMGTAQAGQDTELSLPGNSVVCTPVSVGNPHAVLFVENAETAPVESLGRQIERHPAFPGGVNVEFVQVLSPTELRMRVWERGSGVTMACGTGACASVVAAAEKGFCPFDVPVFVRLDGGTLEVTVSRSGKVFMTGPAEIVYEGETAIC